MGVVFFFRECSQSIKSSLHFLSVLTTAPEKLESRLVAFAFVFRENLMRGELKKDFLLEKKRARIFSKSNKSKTCKKLKACSANAQMQKVNLSA